MPPEMLEMFSPQAVQTLESRRVLVRGCGGVQGRAGEKLPGELSGTRNWLELIKTNCCLPVLDHPRGEVHDGVPGQVRDYGGGEV